MTRAARMMTIGDDVNDGKGGDGEYDDCVDDDGDGDGEPCRRR